MYRHKEAIIGMMSGIHCRQVITSSRVVAFIVPDGFLRQMKIAGL